MGFVEVVKVRDFCQKMPVFLLEDGGEPNKLTWTRTA